MPATATERTHNRLLDALPCEELERLRGKLRPVHLSQGRTIYEAGELANYVYFPSSGLVALLSATAEGETVEVGMVGSEGTTGVPLIMHARNTPFRALVQVPMLALCAEARVIQNEVQQGGRLAEILICYAHTVFAQLAQSAVCNRFHTAEQRLCRWLVSARDRVTDDTLALTQESLAATLGTQRSMVSTALTELQKNQLISYSRGSITILDRMGLAASACECYEALKDQTCRCIDS